MTSSLLLNNGFFSSLAWHFYPTPLVSSLVTRAAIVGTTDMFLVFYCNDIYKAIKSRGSLRPTIPFLVKYWWGLPVIVLFGVSMVVMDAVISYYSVRGAAGAR